MTITAIYDWVLDRTVRARSEEEGRRSSSNGEFRSRALPKEDICLYVKAINNQDVIRPANPAEVAASAGVSSSALVVAGMLVLLLLPGGYNLVAARRMESFRKEQASLQNELQRLRIKESGMLSARQLKNWAGENYQVAKRSDVIVAPATGPVTAAVANTGTR